MPVTGAFEPVMSTKMGSSARRSRMYVWCGIFRIVLQIRRPRVRLCLVTTSPLIVQRFLIPLLCALTERYDVTLVVNEHCSDLMKQRAPLVRVRVFPIVREISLFWDFVALLRMALFLFRERPAGIVTVAPKAGLIGMLAAALARVPFRCHVFQGEVWATRRNPMRALLKACDRLIAGLAKTVLVISDSEGAFLVREKVIDFAHARVLGHGSLAGVDTELFVASPERRARFRKSLGISDQAIVLLYLGRVKRDKGVLDLVAAWKAVAPIHPMLHLAIIGPDEDGLHDQIHAAAGAELSERLHVHGLTNESEVCIAGADILALPSYREGLGTVILEAASCEVPVVGSRIYGIVDALIEGETGLTFPPGDRAALSQCVDKLVRDPLLRARFGSAGRSLIKSRFDQKDVVSRFVDFISAQISTKPRWGVSEFEDQGREEYSLLAAAPGPNQSRTRPADIRPASF